MALKIEPKKSTRYWTLAIGLAVMAAVIAGTIALGRVGNYSTKSAVGIQVLLVGYHIISTFRGGTVAVHLYPDRLEIFKDEERRIIQAANIVSVKPIFRGKKLYQVEVRTEPPAKDGVPVSNSIGAQAVRTTSVIVPAPKQLRMRSIRRAFVALELWFLDHGFPEARSSKSSGMFYKPPHPQELRGEWQSPESTVLW